MIVLKPRAYYNEFDPGAAAWLRELIQAGEIAPGDVDERRFKGVTKPNLDRSARSASGQGADDKLDIKPRPCSATAYLPLNASALAVHAQDDARSQSLGSPRRTGRIAGRLGSGSRSGGSDYRRATALWCELGKLPPLLGAYRGTSERRVLCLPCGNRQNKATCCAALDQSETEIRTCGKCARCRGWVAATFCGNELCTAPNNIFDGSSIPAFQRRTQRTLAAMYPLSAPLIAIGTV